MYPTPQRKWITREEIAEIYEARADKAQLSAVNGEPGNLDHVVNQLGVEARLRNRAEQIRSIERLSNSIGSRTA